MYKVDLHTHSIASPDGSLNEDNYRKMLETGRLDCIAVTDHNTIAFAKELHANLGDRIIVGEEITTLDGEIIGLF
jgi:Predicted metal-dependent phosphoesterases (PHP family)